MNLLKTCLSIIHIKKRVINSCSAPLTIFAEKNLQSEHWWQADLQDCHLQIQRCTSIAIALVGWEKKYDYICRLCVTHTHTHTHTLDDLPYVQPSVLTTSTCQSLERGRPRRSGPPTLKVPSPPPPPPSSQGFQASRCFCPWEFKLWRNCVFIRPLPGF